MASYHFADKSRFDGPDRRAKLIDAFRRLTCLPYAEAIAASTPIGPFNSFSNEDHWIDDPTCPGVVLIGDAAGHNDPIIGQGLSIALRDVRLVSEILREAKTAGQEPDFRPYVEERAERMRRLRITAQVVTTAPRRIRSRSTRATRASRKALGGGPACTPAREPDRSGTLSGRGFFSGDDREIAGVLTRPYILTARSAAAGAAADDRRHRHNQLAGGCSKAGQIICDIGADTI